MENFSFGGILVEIFSWEVFSWELFPVGGIVWGIVKTPDAPTPIEALSHADAEPFAENALQEALLRSVVAHPPLAGRAR